MADIIQDLFQESVAPQHKLGEIYTDPFGDKYRYVQAGASALVTGNLLQEAAEDVQFRSMAVQAAVAIGSQEIPVTLGSTATTANMFENGTLIIESSTGIGQKFRIVRHEVAAGAATCKFWVDRPVKIALTTSSQASVRKNAYDGVIQFPTTPTGGPVGVALYAMTAAYYGWIQSGGDCPVLFDAGVNTSADIGGLMPSADVAGSVSPAAAADVSPSYIGFAREIASTDSTMGMAHLTID